MKDFVKKCFPFDEDLEGEMERAGEDCFFHVFFCIKGLVKLYVYIINICS